MNTTEQYHPYDNQPGDRFIKQEATKPLPCTAHCTHTIEVGDLIVFDTLTGTAAHFVCPPQQKSIEHIRARGGRQV